MKHRILPIVVIIALLLTACGNGQKTKENGMESSANYAETNEAILSGKEEVFGGTTKIMMQQMPSADAALEEYIPEGGSCSDVMCDIGQEMVYRLAVLQSQEDWTEGYCLETLEYPYEEWKCYVVEKSDWQKDGSPYAVCNTFLDHDNNLQVLLSDAQQETFCRTEWNRQSGWQELNAVESDEEFMADMAEETARGRELQPDKKVFFLSDQTGYSCTLSGLKKLSLTDNTEETVVDFAKEGYSIQFLYGIAVDSEENVLLLVKMDEETKLLKVLNKPLEVQGTELEIAMIYASPFFRELIVNFNREHPEYQIKLRLVGDNENYADYRNRIAAEISSGKGPDLIENYCIGLDQAVEKGYLKDMTEFCRQYQDEVWSAAWECGEKNGNQYLIPYQCTLRTVVTRKELADDRQSWTLDEMLQILKESDSCAVEGTLDGYLIEKEELFGEWGITSKAKTGLIDWETMQSHLDSDISRQLMQYIKEHPYEGSEEQQGMDIAEGVVPMVKADIAGMYQLGLVDALFQGQEVYIGHPVENGQTGHFLSCNGFVVNQNSDNKEAIETFLDYLLSQQVQMRITKEAYGRMPEGLPVKKDCMDDFCEAIQKEDVLDSYNTSYPNSYQGFEYYMKPITKENIERFRMALESATPDVNVDDIYSIICEEAAPYFQGDKTADNVIDIMQNRTQLYLDEMN